MSCELLFYMFKNIIAKAITNNAYRFFLLMLSLKIQIPVMVTAIIVATLYIGYTSTAFNRLKDANKNLAE